MSRASPESPRKTRPPRKDFTWGIRSTDIGFMGLTAAEAALDGSAGSCDCSAIARMPPRPRERAARRPAK